jgi:RimJ/RimL family protein N-acetyltransferase
MGRYFAKLRGEKVYLSPIHAEDSETYTRWLNNLGTSVPLGAAAQVLSLDRERELLKHLGSEGHTFAIVERGSDTLVGNCGIRDLNAVNATAEVGIFIGEEKRRSKGLGTDALLLLAAYAFKILNLHNLMLRTASFNARAIRCYEKAGFREMGRRAEAIRVGGKRHDDVFMQLLAADFRCPYLDDELPA